MKKFQIIFISLALALNSCDFLDVVPDNIATIEDAFNMRIYAERFLYTCYSYVPAHGNLAGNIARAAGDEIWLPDRNTTSAWNIARGNQRVNEPYMNFWQGRNGAKDLYEGIRQCNIFLDNIERVPDMTTFEKERWRGEVYFLKAYYHFYLLRMYGPIPLIKENVPVTADIGEVYPTRNTIDDCFAYVEELLDEAIKRLPTQVYTTEEYGRITKAAAYALKAIALTEAASPLFNGNGDYIGFKNIRGEELFDREEKIEKWQKAAAACKRTIEFCDSMQYGLYHFPVGNWRITTDTIKTQMSIRNALTEKDMTLNPEIIWGNTNSYAGDIQQLCIPRGLMGSGATYYGNMAPTLKIAEMFYSDKGVPIEDDTTYNYAGRWEINTCDKAHNLYLREGLKTVNLHFHREPRFYADLGFDCGVWFGHGTNNMSDESPASIAWVEAKKGQACAAQNEIRYSVTGYWAKKLVNYELPIGNGNTSGGTAVDFSPSMGRFAWPEIRLASIYLLYAETLNEAERGPSAEAFYYIDEVRKRAGLKGVVEAWSQYTERTDYDKYEGFKRIVRRERLIELVFEGQRYWDLRRWKEATSVLNAAVKGWDINQEDEAGYYRQKTLFNQKFTTRDYFWPIPEAELLSNKNLNQFPGW
ncbi:MAG: RagB/SusD family nutrient uptake outer membrane protein [Prevotella sp.]|jgi:hypothetical protein|nr:RagB/SusD family nutrient uptake outer membrane protein [Prevotella sp.]